MANRVRTTLVAGGLAGLVGAIPSTVYLLVTGGNVFASVNALAAMVAGNELPVLHSVAVATAVHITLSFFWASVLVTLLPLRAPVVGALVASAIITILDLKVIAPHYFAEAAALAFVPQLADHLAWGATVGAVLRASRKSPGRKSLR